MSRNSEIKYLVSSFVACLLLIVDASGVPAASSVRTIEIHAKKFTFSPSEITLTKGETVTLDLTSEDVPHSLLIAGLNVKAVMTKGQVTQVTLTPETIGDFDGKCGKFCGFGHGSMRFVVHVVDK